MNNIWNINEMINTAAIDKLTAKGNEKQRDEVLKILKKVKGGQQQK